MGEDGSHYIHKSTDKEIEIDPYIFVYYLLFASKNLYSSTIPPRIYNRPKDSFGVLKWPYFY